MRCESVEGRRGRGSGEEGEVQVCEGEISDCKGLRGWHLLVSGDPIEGFCLLKRTIRILESGFSLVQPDSLNWKRDLLIRSIVIAVRVYCHLGTR